MCIPAFLWSDEVSELGKPPQSRPQTPRGTILQRHRLIHIRVISFSLVRLNTRQKPKKHHRRISLYLFNFFVQLQLQSRQVGVHQRLKINITKKVFQLFISHLFVGSYLGEELFDNNTCIFIVFKWIVEVLS